MHPGKAADHFSLYEEGTWSGPLQYGLLWDYGSGRTHLPAGEGGGSGPAEAFCLPALLPPAVDPPHPLPPSGGRGCVRGAGRKMKHRLHCRGPRFFLRGSARCDRPTKQAPVLCFMKPRKIKKFCR